MAKELEKSILVDGEEYNVNAVQADKLTHKLVVNQVGFSGKTLDKPLVTFDGSGEEDTSFEIVPTTGGKFKGHLRVPDAADTYNNVSNYSDANEDFVDDAVLNYKDIKNSVLTRLINNSVLYKWNGSTLNPVIDTSIAGVSLIAGIESQIQAFAKRNYEAVNKKLSAYLYICTDSKNLYFGTAEDNVAMRLASITDSANVLSTPHTFSVNLADENMATFDGSSDVSLGVNGTLPISKGGTNAVDATAARKNLEITPENIGAAAASHTHNYAGSSTAGGAASSALKATADANGNNIANYYQKKITISSSAPSGGYNGDIWIKY